MPLGCSTSNMIGGGVPYIFPSGGTTNISPSGSKLKNIIIPEGIGSATLSTRFNLNRIVLPSTITTFPTLTNDINLLAVNIPYGVTSLPASAFQNCKSIKKIIVPSTVTSILNSCFRSCNEL